MKKPVCLKIHPDILAKAKKKAAQRAQAFGAVVEHLLADWLEKGEKK